MYGRILLRDTVEDSVEAMMATLSDQDHESYAAEIFRYLRHPVAAVDWNYAVDRMARGNFSRLMVELVSRRLQSSGNRVTNKLHSICRWGAGAFSMKNSRVAGTHWSNASPGIVATIAGYTSSMPAAYLFTHLEIEKGALHLWVVPEPKFRAGFHYLPLAKNQQSRILRIEPLTHRVLRVSSPLVFDQFAECIQLMPDEKHMIEIAIAADDALRDSNEEKDEFDQDVLAIADVDLVKRRAELFAAEAEAIVDIRASQSRIAAFVDFDDFDSFDSLADELVDALRHRRKIQEAIQENRIAIYDAVHSMLSERLPDEAVELLLPKDADGSDIEEMYTKLYHALIHVR